MSDLQTAIDQEDADRNRTVRLWQTCLAGLEPRNASPSLNDGAKALLRCNGVVLNSDGSSVFIPCLIPEAAYHLSTPVLDPNSSVLQESSSALVYFQIPLEIS